jgi:hypothetical protein
MSNDPPTYSPTSWSSTEYGTGVTHDPLCSSTVQSLISDKICTFCEVIRAAREDERQKITHQIRNYRIDTLPLITDTVSPYVTGLLRAEIIASGRYHYE